MSVALSTLLMFVALAAGLGAGWMLRAVRQRDRPRQTQAIYEDVGLVGLELYRLQDQLHQAQRVIAGLKGARPAFLSTNPNDPVDDFSVIRGVGELEQLMLHNLGVRSFAQLARLNDQDVAYVASRMEIPPGRIDAEHWVDQARTLAMLRGQSLD